MALRAILDSLDGLEPAIAALYAEQEIAGKTMFVLALDGVDTLPQVRGLKTAHDATKVKLTAAQAALATATARLEGLPEDFDHDQFETLRTAAEKGTKAPDQAEIDRIVSARVVKETAKEKKRADDAEAKATRTQERLHSTERTRLLTDELTRAGVTDPDFAAAARVMLAGKTKVVEDDDGTITVLGLDSEFSTDVPLSEMVAGWAKSSSGKKFVSAAESDGGGAPGGGPGRPAGTGRFTKDNFNLTEFGALAKANPVEARRVAIACGKPQYANL